MITAALPLKKATIKHSLTVHCVAESEFEKYRIVQDRLFESDFDKMAKRIERERPRVEGKRRGKKK